MGLTKKDVNSGFIVLCGEVMKYLADSYGKGNTDCASITGEIRRNTRLHGLLHNSVVDKTGLTDKQKSYIHFGVAMFGDFLKILR